MAIFCLITSVLPHFEIISVFKIEIIFEFKIELLIFRGTLTRGQPYTPRLFTFFLAVYYNKKGCFTLIANTGSYIFKNLTFKDLIGP